MGTKWYQQGAHEVTRCHKLLAQHRRSCQSLVFPLGRMASLSISTQDFLCRPGAQVSPIALHNDHRINWLNAINMVSLILGILGLFDDEKGTSKWTLAQLLDSTCMFLSCILLYHDLATSLRHTEQFNVHAHHARRYRQIDLAYLHIWHAFQ